MPPKHSGMVPMDNVDVKIDWSGRDLMKDEVTYHYIKGTGWVPSTKKLVLPKSRSNNLGFVLVRDDDGTYTTVFNSSILFV